MATQTVTLDSHPEEVGSSLELWDKATNLRVQAAAATETVWSSGSYLADFIDAAADTYVVKHRDAAGEVIWTSGVKLALTTATFHAHDAAFVSSDGVDIASIRGSTIAAVNLNLSAGSIITGTVGSSSTTTSVITSALSLPGTDTDQFKGRLIQFLANTTTAGLRGEIGVISASTISATPTLTISSALTTAPVSTDTFIIL